jgi:hypothetical protein
MYVNRLKLWFLSAVEREGGREWQTCTGSFCSSYPERRKRCRRCRSRLCKVPCSLWQKYTQKLIRRLENTYSHIQQWRRHSWRKHSSKLAAHKFKWHQPETQE